MQIPRTPESVLECRQSVPKAKCAKKTLDKENLHVAKSEVYVTFVSDYSAALIQVQNKSNSSDSVNINLLYVMLSS